jgi:hypothetical protein
MTDCMGYIKLTPPHHEPFICSIKVLTRFIYGKDFDRFLDIACLKLLLTSCHLNMPTPALTERREKGGEGCTTKPNKELHDWPHQEAYVETRDNLYQL